MRLCIFGAQAVESGGHNMKPLSKASENSNSSWAPPNEKSPEAEFAKTKGA